MHFVLDIDVGQSIAYAKHLLLDSTGVGRFLGRKEAMASTGGWWQRRVRVRYSEVQAVFYYTILMLVTVPTVRCFLAARLA